MMFFKYRINWYNLKKNKKLKKKKTEDSKFQNRMQMWQNIAQHCKYMKQSHWRGQEGTIAELSNFGNE